MDKVPFNAPDVAPILRAIGFKGRTVYRVTGRESISLHGTYWDNGHRTSYFTVNTVTGKVKPFPHYSPVQFGGPSETPTAEIPAGHVIAALQFAGTRKYVTIYTR